MLGNAPERDSGEATQSPSSSGARWYRALIWALWVLLLVSIPVTSAPQVSALLGENAVSPLALIPLAGLIVFWFGPYVARRGRLPAISWPFLAFITLAILSALAAPALPIYPIKGQDLVSREFRALVTIGLSLGFFWTAAILPGTDGELTASLRALSIGGIVTLAWSSVQAWVILSGRTHVPLWLTNTHHLLSIRDPLVDRVTGLAFEPSWLGDQLVVLYLPFWLSSVLCRSSSFPKFRSVFQLGGQARARDTSRTRPPKRNAPESRRIPPVELLLVLWGIGILVLTKSRISLLSFLMVVFVLFLVVTWRVTGRLASRWTSFLQVLRSEGGRRALHLALEAVLLGVLLIGVVGGAFIAGRTDRRMRHLLTLPDLLPEIRHYFPNDVPYEIANRLAFAERVVYWADGFRVFEQYPWLGVGPGNAGFFFERSLPDYGRRLTEIRNILLPADGNFPNTKNLWVRLLAETGIGGFTVFVVWLGFLALMAWDAWKRDGGVRKVVGLAALLALLAQLGEGFSLDSFALPQLWVMLGLLAAAAWRRDRVGLG